MIPFGLASPTHLLPRLAKIQVAAKTTLLAQGDTSTKMFIIHQGCIRACFNKEGTIITAQFFVEDEAATAFESFMNRTPSQYSLECIEPCELSLLTKTDFDHFLSTDPSFQAWFYQTTLQKLIRHTNRLLSFIKDSPQERYRYLVEHQPELLRRIPQHYIASYLGVTSVSLSRIKNRN